MSGKRRQVQSVLSVWDAPALLAAFSEAGVKESHAIKLWGHLLRHPYAQWTDVPQLPKAALHILDTKFAKFTTKVIRCQTSADQDTTKLLISLQDGQQVESVIMHYDTRTPVEDGDVNNNNTGDTTDHDDFHSCASLSDDEQEQNLNLLPTQGEVESSATQQQQQLGSSCAPLSRSSLAASSQQGKGKKTVRGSKRATLCVSSQVGCQMGCTFCATGTMGLRGNLTSGEIIEQLVHAHAISPIRNIVFMGMGEPLANYDAVRAAVGMMTDNRLFRLSRRHVTISTVGVIPRIKQLAQDLPGVSLALSLHAPNQQLRASIVPSARAYPLDRLMQAVQQYAEASKQRVFVEVCLLAGVNDSDAEAHELGVLLKAHNATLNLIPWNPVIAAVAEQDPAKGGLTAPMAFAAPSQERVSAFQAILKEQYGIPTTVRQEKGQDIAGACGQLVIQQAQEVANGTVQGQQKSAASEGCCSGGSCTTGSNTTPSQAQASGTVKDIEELAASR